MADFFQTGAIATLHRLGKPNVDRLERELIEYKQETPIALILPCHIKQMGTPALRRIVKELSQVKYLAQIVVGIDRAAKREWEKARRFFSQLPQKRRSKTSRSGGGSGTRRERPKCLGLLWLRVGQREVPQGGDP